MKYNDCKVSIEDNDNLVNYILPSICRGTYTDGVLSGIGGFCSLYQIPNSDTVVAASTDGIGSKLQLAEKLSNLSTIGFDLVGMVINDVITCGAKPLFFLDYLAIHNIKTTQDRIRTILTSVSQACRLCDTAFIGGETAELPSLMAKREDYDIAGFGVGVVQKGDILGAHKVEVGDVVIGIESSGPHSNGYSLIQKVFNDSDWEDGYLRDSILRPTLLYYRIVRWILCNEVHAMAHITGGGVEYNTSRVIPPHFKVDYDLPKLPPIFELIQSAGSIDEQEMRSVFNCGIGFTLIVKDCNTKNTIIDGINNSGFKAFQIGKVIYK